MYHGGILSPQTGQRRPEVTTLARLDHRDATLGVSTIETPSVATARAENSTLSRQNRMNSGMRSGD